MLNQKKLQIHKPKSKNKNLMMVGWQDGIGEVGHIGIKHQERNMSIEIAIVIITADVLFPLQWNKLWPGGVIGRR